MAITKQEPNNNERGMEEEEWHYKIDGRIMEHSMKSIEHIKTRWKGSNGIKRKGSKQQQGARRELLYAELEDG